jgi:hypothetical protein
MFCRSRRLHCFWAFFTLVFACPTDASAYEIPLTPPAIHEAYVLGQRNDQATADFFNRYLKQLKEEGAAGAHIAEIEILTPFAQLVDDSRANAAKGYTEQDAEKEYRRRGNTIIVRVLLMFPEAYPKPETKTDSDSTRQATPPSAQNAPLRPENFWQNFQFSMKQRGKVIPTRSIRNKPIYSAATKDAPSVLDGATVWLEYDAKDVASEPAAIEVVTPEAKNINASFDLKALR